jgi:SAM-dependent methyltransferase
MKNQWGHDITPIDEIIRQSEHRDIISNSTAGMLGAIGRSSSEVQEVLSILFDSSFSGNIQRLEKVLHDKITSQGGSPEIMRAGMDERAKVIHSEIKEYLLGDSLADIGCGSGVVSWLSRDNFTDILLYDEINYLDPKVKLPFVNIPSGSSFPLDRSFDCTLLLTVLHHAEHPLKLLQDVWKCTKQRLIIIESVFDISPSQLLSSPSESGQYSQFINAIFCDWFYNRVLNQNVHVPYNFDTPDNWCKTFEELPAIISHKKDLGIDINIVPEHHYLFVLDRKC